MFKKILTLVSAVALVVQVHAAEMTPAEAQAQGRALGSEISNGAGSPNALGAHSGVKPGADNVFGSEYTGTTDPAQAQKRGASSMIGLGNTTRTEVNAGFEGYSNSRADQANQAVYFLDKNPILKPTLSSDDPMFQANMLTAPDGFASSTTKTCKQKTITSNYDNGEIYSCKEGHQAYKTSCTIEFDANAFIAAKKKEKDVKDLVITASAKFREIALRHRVDPSATDAVTAYYLSCPAGCDTTNVTNDPVCGFVVGATAWQYNATTNRISDYSTLTWPGEEAVCSTMKTLFGNYHSGSRRTFPAGNYDGFIAERTITYIQGEWLYTILEEANSRLAAAEQEMATSTKTINKCTSLEALE